MSELTSCWVELPLGELCQRVPVDGVIIDVLAVIIVVVVSGMNCRRVPECTVRVVIKEGE